jgi:hypothetical protein
MEKLFKDEEGKPKLREAYCAFTDVLGFKEMIKKSSKNNADKKLFDTFFTTINDELKFMEGPKDVSYSHTELYLIKSFTDNVIIGYPITSGDGESEWGLLSEIISVFQLNMAVKGFFLRGGISFGLLYMDHNIVYGPALIEAYELESEDADDPRIILSPKCKCLLKNHLRYYAKPDFAPHTKVLLSARDGHAFINYLDQLLDPGCDGYCLNFEKLMLHKKQLEEKLIEFRKNNKIWQKYRSLSSYHNHFCNLHSEKHKISKNYFVDNIEDQYFDFSSQDDSGSGNINKQ